MFSCPVCLDITGIRAKYEVKKSKIRKKRTGLATQDLFAMKTQSWTAEIDGNSYHIRYTCSRFSRRATLQINGESFPVDKEPKEEIFRLGEEQAILCIDRRGNAAIRLRDGLLPEQPC